MDIHCINNGRILNDINSDNIYECHLDTETQNQQEIIASAEKIFTKDANIAETIPANQNEPNDVDKSEQKTTQSTESPFRFQIHEADFYFRRQ